MSTLLPCAQWLQAEISERQLAQEAMRKAKEDAEQATKSKSDFLSNMSHEIRTPMNAVLGLSRLLADTELSGEQSQYLSMITSSGELLLSIINDILDFSKIESQKLELEHRDLSLLDCVENAVQLCYDMAGKKGLDLTYLVDPRCPAVLVGDVTRLQQIILNLLSNACKFTSNQCVHRDPSSTHSHSPTLDAHDHSKCRHGEVVLTVTARALGPLLPPPNDPFYHNFLAASPSELMASPSPLTRSRRLTARQSSRTSSPPTLTASLAVASGAGGSPTTPISVLSSPYLGLSSRTVRGAVKDDSRRSTLTISAPGSSSPLRPLPASSTASPLTSNSPVSSSLVPPPAAATRYRILFAVRDSGIGIREDVQKKLFNSFTQAESSTTRRFGGTGLGLAISKRLAEAMGGEMWLTSVEGQGSTFYFTINTTSNEGPGKDEGVQRPPTGQGVGTSAVDPPRPGSKAEALGRVWPVESEAGSAGAPREVRGATTVPAAPSSALHALSAEEMAQLKGLRVLIVCEPPASSKMFALLALSYHMQVLCVDSAAKAVSTLTKIRHKQPVEVVSALALQPASDSPAPALPAAELSAGGTAASTPPVSQAAKHKQDVRLLLASLSLGKDAPASTLSAVTSSSTSTTFSLSMSPTHSLEAGSLPSAASKKSIGPSVNVTSGLASVPHVDVVIFDCDSGDYDEGLQSVEATLQANNHPSVLCVVSSRRREDRRERAGTIPTSAVLDAPSPNPSHSVSPHPRDSVPTIQAHNLNLTQEPPKEDDRRISPGGSEAVGRALSPLPPSPQEAGDVEVVVVMRPLKQRDLLRAICSALLTLDEVKAAKANAATAAAALPAGPTSDASAPVLPRAASLSPTVSGPQAQSAAVGAASPASARPGASVSAPGSRLPMRKMTANPSSHIRNMAIEAPLQILLAEDNKARGTARVTPLQTSPCTIPHVSLTSHSSCCLCVSLQINQKMMSMLLGKLGYTIVIAENGREVIDIVTRGVLPQQIDSGKQRSDTEPPPIPAVALLDVRGKDDAAVQDERRQFDVILMDVSMEEMDGLQCTEYLRANYDRLWPGNAGRARRPYIIACTANASSEFQKKCQDVGMDDWVSKPVEIQQLVRALNSAYSTLQGKPVGKK